jgi:hypothetical protein
MGPSDRDNRAVLETIPASRLSEADRILLLAARAWPAAGGSGEAALACARLWERLGRAWRRRLGEAWEGGATEVAPGDPGSARDEIRRAHAATARVDAARVHPSWWVRALREESPAVQRVVAATAPEPVRHAVQAGLLLDNADLLAERPGDPQVRAWVLSLWTERLVGGEPERVDDPAAIVVLTRLAPRTAYRLCGAAGLGKLALAGEPPKPDVPRQTLHARWQWLQERLASADAAVQEQARGDVRSVPPHLPSRQVAARIGLLTIARLLADCEPFRVRWALQHWPYPLAKLTRSLMPPASQRAIPWQHGESMVLKAAWDRLGMEGRLPMAWPGPD